MVGFDESDEWRLQREWFRAGLKIPLQFVVNWRATITTPRVRLHPHWRPDLILFELKDPIGASLDLLKWVRMQPSMREVIMVACSEDCDDPHAKRAYALRADCCVRKSNDFREIIQTLRTVESYWFGNRSTGQQAA